jgi:hypothetical protein
MYIRSLLEATYYHKSKERTTGEARPQPLANNEPVDEHRTVVPVFMVMSAHYRLRRSRRALRFLLPILRRRRGLPMRSPFHFRATYGSDIVPLRLVTPSSFEMRHQDVEAPNKK